MEAAERLAVAEAMTAALISDWHAEGGPAATSEVWLDDDEAVCIHVWQDGMGGGTTPSAWAEDRLALEVEVADYVQSELIDNCYAVFPTCPTHGAGVHPRAHDGVTAWWCGPGNHSMGAVGTLG